MDKPNNQPTTLDIHVSIGIHGLQVSSTIRKKSTSTTATTTTITTTITTFGFRLIGLFFPEITPD